MQLWSTSIALLGCQELLLSEIAKLYDVMEKKTSDDFFLL